MASSPSFEAAATFGAAAALVSVTNWAACDEHAASAAKKTQSK